MEDKTIAKYHRFVVVSLFFGGIASVLFVSPFLLQNDLLRTVLKDYRSFIRSEFFKLLLLLFAVLGCDLSFYVLGKNIAEDRDNKLKRFATFSFALNMFLIVITACLFLLPPKVSYDYSVISSSLIP